MREVDHEGTSSEGECPQKSAEGGRTLSTQPLKITIRNNYVRFVESLLVTPICDYLLMGRVLNYEHIETIQAASTQQQKARVLLDILRRRPDNTAKICFYEALKETDLGFLAELLEV